MSIWPRGRLVVATSLLLAGGWQLGDGLYIEAKAWAAQQLLQQAWSESRSSAARVTPWPWADTWPMARLRVTRLGVDQILLAGASGRTLAFGPGHLNGSAPPGDPGNTVISGHRDTHFSFLRELRNGERIELLLPDGRALRYAVIRRSVQDQADTWLLDQRWSGLTLITCYPFDALVPGGRGRFVVQAEPVLM